MDHIIMFNQQHIRFWPEELDNDAIGSSRLQYKLPIMRMHLHAPYASILQFLEEVDGVPLGAWKFLAEHNVIPHRVAGNDQMLLYCFL